jgi:hypothetical protein
MALDPFFLQFPGVRELLWQTLAVPELPVEKLLLSRGFELVPGMALAEFQAALWGRDHAIEGLDRRRDHCAYRGLDRRRPGVRFLYPEPVTLQIQRSLAHYDLTPWAWDLALKEWWVWQRGTLARFAQTACCHALSIHRKHREVA